MVVGYNLGGLASLQVKGHFLFRNPHEDDKQPLPEESDKPIDNTRPHVFDEKLSALRTFRCARGLCQRYTEKWSRDHKCPPTIQLHVMQEVLDICQLEDGDILSKQESNRSLDAQLFPAVSLVAVQGVEAIHTMKFQGVIQNIEVFVLVDLGSSHSFPSTRLSGVSALSAFTDVCVADGGHTVGSRHLLGDAWSI
jgi:hypothetical protein